MSIRILFVDDDEKVLEAIQRWLFDKTDDWELEFATSGAEALQLFEAHPFDLVVVDLLMPGMDGVELLTRIRQNSPQTIRFVLSGRVDIYSADRALRVAHQLLSKPCKPQDFYEAIERALGVQQSLKDERLRSLVAGMESLPSQPEYYAELMQALEGKESSAEQIAWHISRDVAMTTNILRYANSAVFGFRQPVTDIARAVVVLGTSMVRSMTLLGQIHSYADKRKMPPHYSALAFAQHALSSAVIARAIASHESDDMLVSQGAFTGGLLHDVGKVVLGAEFAAEYEMLHEAARESHTSLVEAEKEFFGATHAEVGGYLLNLWALPTLVVESVLYHHTPGASRAHRFVPLTAVHFANAYLHGQQGEAGADEALDRDFLRRTGLMEHVPAWERVSREVGVGAGV